MRSFANLLMLFLMLASLPACSAPALPELAATISLPSPTPSAQPSVTPAPAQATAPPSATPPPAGPAAEPIWLANAADQSVLRVDPASGQIEAVIRIDGRPDAVAAADGWVWALDRQAGLLYRIDPRRQRVTGELQLPAGDAAALVTGQGAVWVGMTEQIDLAAQLPGSEAELVPDGVVLRVDPRSVRVTERYPVQPVSQVRLVNGALWVLSSTVVETTLQIYDLASGQGAVMPIQNGPQWLPLDAFAVGEQALWLYSAAYGKIFHAGPDGRIRSAISLEERQPVGYADLLLTDSGLWALTTWGTVLHIDPVTNQVLGRVEFNAPLTRLVASPGAVWALSEQIAMLFRIDPLAHSVAQQVETGSLLQPTVVPTPTTRVVQWKPCPDAPTSRLKVGDIAYVTKDPPLPNRVRQEPNREAEILGLIRPGGGMNILDGPSCGNGWVWWRVKNADLEGWTPEGDFQTYWLVPLYK